MTLIYRAVWNDPAHHAVRVLDDEFTDWCTSKGIDGDDIPHRGSVQIGNRSLDIRRGDAEFGQVMRATLREPSDDGRWWTTTATAFYRPTYGGTYWVDLDCESPPGDRLPMAAPRLVRRLLAEEGEPNRQGIELSEKPFPAVGVAAGMDLADLVLDGDRDLPIVVLSPDSRVTVDVNGERARLAAETLAAVAAVYVLSPAACDAFNSRLADGFKVYGGAVRLYLPGVNLTDEADANRHRFFPVYTFDRNPRRAGQLIAARLAAMQLWPDPPEMWDDLRALVLRPSEAEIAQRVSDLAKDRAVNVNDSEALRREIDELRGLLVVAEAERDAITNEMVAELDRHKRRVEQLESDHVDDVAELEDRDLLIANLQKTIRLFHLGGKSDSDEPAGEEFEDPDPADLVPSTALLYARELLQRVEIHPEAEQRIDELDEAYKARPWGSTTWQALRALNDYAVDTSNGGDPGNFKIWCAKTGRFSERKIAYSESTTVKTGAMAEQRMLPISTAIDPSGRLLMLWHIKIQEGGGTNIPRLYFHDDTRGVTGKIHVGFYGPHYLMPNTKTN